MKKAFSLFEIIIVLVIFSILISFIISKSESSISSSTKIKIKSEIALIRSSISKLNTKKILLQEESDFSLDDAKVDVLNTELFENILDFPLISTNSTKKEIGSWIKSSTNKYLIYIEEDIFLKFEYENRSFECKSDVSICKEFE